MKVKKAYEITDAKIQFVSLVDKAANLKSFLITKAKDGQASFSTYGRLVVKDADKHFVTGVVYEPMAEDAHGNFMTEDEITKAAYYFAKAGGKIDLQHNFEPATGVAVVESWIAKADFNIGDEAVKKGTWLMTAEITDGDLWDAVEKGEITGFSMGGVGNYSEEDVNLDNVEKSAEKKGLFKRLAETFGFEVVEKGEMADRFAERMQAQKFWTAFNTLQDVLSYYDYHSDKTIFEGDETKVKEALAEFSQIVQELLTSGAPIAKALAAGKPVEKAGKKLSGKNREALQGIYDQLGTFLAAFDEPEKKPDEEKPDEGDEPEQDPKDKPPEDGGDNDNDKEDKEVKKSEVETLIQEAVTKALEKQTTPPAAGPETVTAEAVQKMVDEAITKALTPEGQDEQVTAEAVAKMVEEAVAKAVEPVLKARGVPSALNDGEPVEKEAPHYLHGII